MINILKAKKVTVTVLVITIITSLFMGTSVSSNAANTDDVNADNGVFEKAYAEPVGEDPQPVSEPASEEPAFEPTTDEPTTEPISPTTLTLNMSAVTLGINETFRLIATTDAQSVDFSVKNTSIASVSEDGLIQPKKTGSTVVICTAENNLKAECTLTVRKEAKSFKLSNTAGTLGVGEGCYVTAVLPSDTAAYYKTYASSNKSIATVNSEGYVISKAAGTVTITCTLKNGVSAKISVKIMPAAKKVTLNTNVASLGIGETFDLNSTIPSGTASAYRNYYSDNTKIARVTKSGGLITAISTGKTTVRCVTGTGAKATVTVTVTKAPTKLTLKSTASQSVGKQYTLTVSTDKGSDSGRFFKWGSSNPSVVTISKYKNNVATLSPKSSGTATITVKTFNGKTATYKISVSSTAVTETQLRNKVVKIMNGWLGAVEGDKVHAEILKIYNNQTNLPYGYKMRTHDAWCAATVSAVWIKAGIAQYTGTDCNCGGFRDKAIAKGIWVENDAYKPKVADAIIYNWSDNGVGDNKGSADHIGLVTAVSGNSFTVTEGNMGTGVVGKRTMQVNGKYIRGFITPKYAEIAKKLGGSTATNTTAKTVSTVAVPSIVTQGVANGKWLKVVKDGKDYSGVMGKSLVALASKVNKGTIEYSVHIKGGGWLGTVTGFNSKDHKNGYAGKGYPAEKGIAIDGIKMNYRTPSDVANKYGRYKVAYRVHLLGGNWLAWQYNTETKNGKGGYAGTIGKTIDGVQVKLVKA